MKTAEGYLEALFSRLQEIVVVARQQHRHHQKLRLHLHFYCNSSDLSFPLLHTGNWTILVDGQQQQQPSFRTTTYKTETDPNFLFTEKLTEFSSTTRYSLPIHLLHCCVASLGDCLRSCRCCCGIRKPACSHSILHLHSGSAAAGTNTNLVG